MNIASFILLAGLIGASAVLSGSETALFSLSRHQLYLCRHSPHRLRRLAAQLMQRPRSVLLTVLIGNTTVNILIFASSFVLSEHLSEKSAVLASVWGVVTVMLVIVVGEVLAKSLAMSAAYTIAPWIAWIIKLLQLVCLPISVCLDVLLVTPITRLIIGGAEENPAELTTEELNLLVELSNQQGIIAREENDMLQEVVALSNTCVRRLMIPRVDIIAFDLSGTRDQLLRLYREKRLNKVPAYDNDIDHMVGLIHARDVYRAAHEPLVL